MNTPDQERIELDTYLTPFPLAQAITKRVFEFMDARGYPSSRVIEPSVGGGAFGEAVLIQRPSTKLTVVDINPLHVERFKAAYPETEAIHADWGATDHAYGNRFDLCIGNPPYGVAETHVRAALNRSKVVAFLLRLGFTAGKDRCRDLYVHNPLSYVASISPRPSFTGGGTDSQEYGVLIWVAGNSGDGVFGKPVLWEP